MFQKSHYTKLLNIFQDNKSQLVVIAMAQLVRVVMLDAAGGTLLSATVGRGKPKYLEQKSQNVMGIICLNNSIITRLSDELN